MTKPTLSCSNCQHYSSESWGNGWDEPRETREWCSKHQWEFEEPTHSPVGDCQHFEFALAECQDDEPINLDDLLEVF